MSEADERLPVGPRGATGERGERGLSRRVRWAIVVLFGIPVVLGLFAIFWVNTTVTANNHKFCQVINATTAVPVAKPADPGANPSRETSYQWYLRFAALGRSLGC